MTDADRELIAELVTEVQRLRALIEERLPAPSTPVATHDPEALLAAIAGAVGNVPFTARELVAHAAKVRGLRAALADLNAAGNPRRVGKALLAIAGRDDLGEWRLDRIGEESAGAIWQVVHGVMGLRVCKPTNPSTALLRSPGATTLRGTQRKG